jgi:hypothetical protein
MHAIDSAQALKLLLLAVRRGQITNEKTFHQQMLEIFNSLRDLIPITCYRSLSPVQSPFYHSLSTNIVISEECRTILSPA